MTILGITASSNSLKNYIVFGFGNSPFISVHAWANGFGPRYENPTNSVGSVSGTAFNPSGNAIAYTGGAAAGAVAWTYKGFGAHYTSVTLPAAGTELVFNSSGDTIAVSHGTSPYVSAYPFSTVTGYGAKYADPATLPTGDGKSVAFNPAGTDVAVAHNTSPYISVYPWSSGFGAKYSNPTTLPTFNGLSVTFNPAGTAIAVGANDGTGLHVYAWSSGFGSKYSNPSSSIYPAQGVAFNPQGDTIAFAHNSSYAVMAFPWSNSTGFGTKYADSNPPAGNGASIAFNVQGTAIAVGHSVSPYISTYLWSSAGFGAKFANPDVTNGHFTQVNDISFI